MTYVCEYEVPATVDMYHEVSRRIGDEPVDGLLAHVVVKGDTGLRHLEVWESAADCSRFQAERVGPAVHEVLRAAGFTEMPPRPELAELELVDVKLGP